METQIESNILKKIRAHKFCTVASIILSFSFCLFLLCFLLSYLSEQYNSNLDEFISACFFLSIVIVGLVVPFLGFLAVRNIFSNWRFVTNPEYVPKNKTMIRKIAYSFLTAGLLFAVVPLFLIIMGIIIENLYLRHFPALLSIWFLAMVLLALVMSCISYKLFAKVSVSIRLRIGAIFVILVNFVAMVAVFLSTSLGYYLIQRIEYSKVTETFMGESTSLKKTLIIPTLDSPCPKNKNVIWCSSFQLAWNRMKDDVISAPVEVVDAEELAARLNSAEQTEDDLEPYSVYTAAGRMKQGIISKIQKDMAAKFPKHPIPDFIDFAGISEGILAYSYLIANVPFKYPYRQVKEEFIFTDSNDVETNVGAFGVWGYGSQNDRLRQQAEILYSYVDFNESHSSLRADEFVIDLCRHSKPYQVVVAMVEPKESLAQTLSYIDDRIEGFKKADNYEQMRFLDEGNELIMPEMFWKIDHRFDELIGKIVKNANPSMPIAEAMQTIEFKLDRYGASLESEVNVLVLGIPRTIKFNRPFLVYMKKRDCDQPFFVMWIDNAELLNKK